MTNSNETIILTIPGLNGSGANHWQTQWEQQYKGVIRIEQASWDAPQKNDWVAEIEQAVERYSHHHIILAAHSLGTIAVAHWAALTKHKIRGALLVAPPDIHISALNNLTQSFDPIPANGLPFKSLVVASTNDKFCSIAQAQKYAWGWGSDFVSIGQHGHINAESNLGIWHKGWTLLHSL